ncbi:MAG: hypothetical protein K9N23_02955 [Akkermansiaceae bacterium]|nr:hypothetical protein [Akkermansiaceae bacterium]
MRILQCGRNGLLVGVLALGVTQVARAEVRMAGIFSDHMILQRDKAVPVFGTAAPGEKVEVEFHGQTVGTVADARGAWQVMLAAMSAAADAQTVTIRGTNTLTLKDVLVGDVWLCSGQSNMDMRLGGCERPADIAAADFPGIRQFTGAGNGWRVCRPDTAAGFSGAAFYFARRLWQDQQGRIPVGLLLASVGGSKIDCWLAPDGLVDIPVLHPLYAQSGTPGGPFSLFDSLIRPLAPFGIKGAIWYQGENSELAAQTPDSYYLKMKALVQGWKRVWEMDDFPFYYVMIANYGELLKTETPVLISGGWDADTRLQQANAMALPHAGCASAIDIGVSEAGWPGYHPANKLDVGERLALWALKNDYGRTGLVTSGPTLKGVAVVGGTVVCSFDHLGKGLMVGAKKWYEPTKEVPGGKLQRFVIAGADGVWHAADAVIKGDTVVMSSPQVPAPGKVSYACWQNPEGCNLYNKDGLPAAPFHVTDVTLSHRITATAGPGGAITPAGSRQLLPRMTTFYQIIPGPGHFIQDVEVDGVSVGAVGSYTFDPVAADHTIAATFAEVPPKFTITASASGGGTVSPTGAVRVVQGQAAAFSIAAEGDNRISVAVDGVPLGERSRISFTDVRANHTLAITFSPTIKATAGYGGTITPDGAVAVPYGADKTFAVIPLPGYAIAELKVDGTSVAVAGRHTITKVTASHTLAARFKSTVERGAGIVPKPDQLILACRGDALPDKGAIAAWDSSLPDAKPLKSIGTPAVEIIDGRKYARVDYAAGDGFSAGSYAAPIPCTGASIVVVAKPVRNGAGSGWTSIADVFYDRLVLGIRNDSGLVCVRRNGGVETSAKPIADGQLTILSLVVQPDGAYRVFANGAEIMAGLANSAMTELVPGVAGPYATSITLGRNAPDSWTAFNGLIGDVFLYKTALTDKERQQLEAFLARSLAGN